MADTITLYRCISVISHGATKKLPNCFRIYMRIIKLMLHISWVLLFILTRPEKC